VAKLNAPLFSFGASGAIGKAIVYFPWKGLNVVRQYVVPSNPKSDDQIIQRDYLKAAVALIHEAQALAADALDAADQTAYALYGSTFPTPRTWFNTIVKYILDCRVAGKAGAILCNGTVVNTTPLELTFTAKTVIAYSTEGKLYWGVSKTNMPHSVSADVAAGAISAVASPTVKDIKYYLQWRPDAGTPIDGTRSGIYHKVST